MSNALRLILVVSPLMTAGLLACGGAEGEGALDSVPHPEALTIEVTDGADDPRLAGLASAQIPSEWPTVNDDLTEAREKVAAVNAALRDLFAHVAAVALVNGPPWPGSGKLYGPVDRCTVAVPVGSACPVNAVASFRLWVGNAGIGRGGAFVLQARPNGSTDEAAFRPVVAGWMLRWADRAPRRGHGQVWVNLQNLSEVAPDYPGRGYLYAGFAARPIAKAETLLLVGFTTGDDDPVTAALRGYKTAAGTRRVRIAAVEEYLSGAEGDELGLFHVAYNPSLGGRGYGIIASGDVASGTYVLGRACYAAHAPGAPVYREWFACDSGQGPAACILAAGGVGTPSDGHTGTWNDCPSIIPDGDAFAPPAADESGSAPAAVPGLLPGEDEAGVTAEDVPTSEEGAPAPE